MVKNIFWLVKLKIIISLTLKKKSLEVINIKIKKGCIGTIYKGFKSKNTFTLSNN